MSSNAKRVEMGVIRSVKNFYLNGMECDESTNVNIPVTPGNFYPFMFQKKRFIVNIWPWKPVAESSVPPGIALINHR